MTHTNMVKLICFECCASAQSYFVTTGKNCRVPAGSNAAGYPSLRVLDCKQQIQQAVAAMLLLLGLAAPATHPPRPEVL